MQTELQYWPNKLLQEFSLTYFYDYDAEELLWPSRISSSNLRICMGSLWEALDLSREQLYCCSNSWKGPFWCKNLKCSGALFLSNYLPGSKEQFLSHCWKRLHWDLISYIKEMWRKLYLLRPQTFMCNSCPSFWNSHIISLVCLNNVIYAVLHMPSTVYFWSANAISCSINYWNIPHFLVLKHQPRKY